MKKIFLIFAFTFLLPWAYAQQNPRTPQLNITAHAEKEVVPDLVSIRMTIEMVNEQARTSMDDSVDMKERVLAALTRKTHIKADSIKSLGFQTYEQERYQNKNPYQVYVAREQLELVIPADPQHTAEVLALLAEAAPELQIQLIPQVGKKKLALLEKDLIESVIAKAKEQASIISKASGYEHFSILEVNYHPRSGGVLPRAANYEMMDAQVKSVPQYEFVQQTLRKEMNFIFIMYR